MKLKLTELTERITPLPWQWDGANLMSRDGNVACNPRSGSDKGWVKQGELSLKYAEHAANVLPKLVEALELLCEYGAKPAHMNGCREALRIAREVEI